MVSPRSCCIILAQDAVSVVDLATYSPLHDAPGRFCWCNDPVVPTSGSPLNLSRIGFCLNSLPPNNPAFFKSRSAPPVMGVVIKSTYVFTYREFIDFATLRLPWKSSCREKFIQVVVVAKRLWNGVAWQWPGPGGCDSRPCYLFGSITLWTELLSPARSRLAGAFTCVVSCARVPHDLWWWPGSMFTRSLPELVVGERAVALWIVFETIWNTFILKSWD